MRRWALAALVASVLTTSPAEGAKPRLRLSAPESVLTHELFRVKAAGRASSGGDLLQIWLDAPKKCAKDAKRERAHEFGVSPTGSAIRILDTTVKKGTFARRSGKTYVDSWGDVAACGYLTHPKGSTYRRATVTIRVPSEILR